MTSRRLRRAAAVVTCSAALLATLPSVALAEGAGCESEGALAVRYLSDDDGVQILRNDCALPVRSISYSKYSTYLPLSGFPGEPMKLSRWNCGPSASGPSETTTQERTGTWLRTYAVGWQVKRGDGRWHTLDHVYDVDDHAVVKGKPFATDACVLDPTDHDWEDDVDDGYLPY